MLENEQRCSNCSDQNQTLSLFYDCEEGHSFCADCLAIIVERDDNPV